MKKRDNTFGYALVLVAAICGFIGIALNGTDDFPTLFLLGAVYGSCFMGGYMWLVKSHGPADCGKYDWGKHENKQTETK